MSLKTATQLGVWDIVIANKKATITTRDSIFNINPGEVFENKDITLTLNDSLFLEDQTFSVRRSSLNKTVANLRKNLTAVPASKQGEIVNLNFKGVNQARQPGYFKYHHAGLGRRPSK